MFEDAQDWAYTHHVPLNVSLELTLRCNIRCLHCYNFDRDLPHPSAPERSELSPAEILSLMTDLRKAGCLFLFLTGGEALVHPHLFDYLDHARKLHFSVSLLSNGTLLRPELVRRLKSYANLQTVSISLYGATAASHDAVTQIPGSFERTWAGIEELRRQDLAVRLKFILMKQNGHEAAEMIRQAEEGGYPFLIDATITGRHDGTSGSLMTRLSTEEMDSLYRGPLRSLVSDLGKKVPEEDAGCNCARGNCGISAFGDVYPCISVPWSAGNIRDQPFAEIWKNSPVFQKIRGLKMADYPHCGPCPVKSWCMWERGAAYHVSGEYTGIDPWVCKNAEIAARIGREAGEPG